MRITCRLLFHRAPQSFILASEEVLTKRVGEGRSPTSARLNIFDPPAVLVGFSQDVFEEVNVELAKSMGFEIGRRPTGGGAIVMNEGSPGWEIWIPRSFPGLPSDVEGMYRFLSRVPVEMLKELGVEARYRPKNDIEVGGRKVSGTGLYTIGNGVMYCGTVLIDLDVELMAKLLKIPIEKLSDKGIESLRQRVVTLKEILGYTPKPRDLLEALAKAVEKALGLEIVEGELSEEEMEEIREVEKRYRSEEWIYGFRRATGFERVCTYKTRAGLIRVHVKVVEGVLEQVMITGDFFAYPQRAVLDLEAFIKHSPVEAIVEEVQRFFAENEVEIHGISPRELGELIEKCCRETPNQST